MTHRLKRLPVAGYKEIKNLTILSF